MLRFNLEEAKGRLLELIDAALKGETVLIIKDLQEAVQLVPAFLVARRQFGSAQGLITMADDVDAPDFDLNAKMPCVYCCFGWGVTGPQGLEACLIDRPEACNNCHVMNPTYERWFHTARGEMIVYAHKI